MSVCLDAFAILAWLQNEKGADQVNDCLEKAAPGADFSCFISMINLGEVFYRLYRLRGSEEAEAFWEDARRKLLPVQLVQPTRTRIREAARLKGKYPIAFADAFAAQLAMEKKIPLVTGDPELKTLEKDDLISVFWI